MEISQDGDRNPKQPSSQKSVSIPDEELSAIARVPADHLVTYSSFANIYKSI